MAANIVDLARDSGFKNALNGLAMILNIKPIPDVKTIAVNRQGLSGEGIVNDQWDQLFRKLERPIVIRAVGR